LNVRVLPRRAFLWQWLGVLATIGSWRRRGRRGAVQTTVASHSGYLDLRAPVVVPSRRIADPWSAVHFDARVRRPDSTDVDVLLKGVAVRTVAADGRGEVKAFCLLCPHEICNVEYVIDTAQVRLDAGPPPQHPLLVCPCHFSVFDPLADGARISGPAFRGLYRFATRVMRETVEIIQVEEDVLTLLS